MVECRRYFVAGRVQGVFYRASTRDKAGELRVTGYARNLPDGRVEVFACGAAVALDALSEWLWRGPPRARVSDVTGMPAEGPPPRDFRTL